MTILIFVAAVAVSLVLERQRRRHRYEIRQEFERLSWELPKPEPRIPMLESCLNVLLGMIMLVFGILILRAYTDLKPGMAVSGWGNMVALFVSSGIALVIVGGMAVWQNVKYKKILNTS
jgi:hypothetical protein